MQSGVRGWLHVYSSGCYTQASIIYSIVIMITGNKYHTPEILTEKILSVWK